MAGNLQSLISMDQSDGEEVKKTEERMKNFLNFTNLPQTQPRQKHCWKFPECFEGSDYVWVSRFECWFKYDSYLELATLVS